MKFVDQAGAVVNVYQQVTELVDEHMLTAGYCGMNQTQATTAGKQLVDTALGGFYSAVTMQVHTDYGATTWLGNMAAYAQSKGMPIWTAQRWLNFHPGSTRCSGGSADVERFHPRAEFSLHLSHIRAELNHPAAGYVPDQSRYRRDRGRGTRSHHEPERQRSELSCRGGARRVAHGYGPVRPLA
jgi:hypothetical protein